MGGFFFRMSEEDAQDLEMGEMDSTGELVETELLDSEQDLSDDIFPGESTSTKITKYIRIIVCFLFIVAFLSLVIVSMTTLFAFTINSNTEPDQSNVGTSLITSSPQIQTSEYTSEPYDYPIDTDKANMIDITANITLFESRSIMVLLFSEIIDAIISESGIHYTLGEESEEITIQNTVNTDFCDAGYNLETAVVARDFLNGTILYDISVSSRKEKVENALELPFDVATQYLSKEEQLLAHEVNECADDFVRAAKISGLSDVQLTKCKHFLNYFPYLLDDEDYTGKSIFRLKYPNYVSAMNGFVIPPEESFWFFVIDNSIAAAQELLDTFNESLQPFSAVTNC